ncbi:MAG TPA: DNA recombination protein RmuC [Acidimicrobiia bacterium]|nr:DNA recombination protein RmuC [Acidimicrobiia bacterium]
MSVETMVVIVIAVLTLTVAAVAVVLVVRTRKPAVEVPPVVQRDQVLDEKVSQLGAKLESIEKTVTSQKAVLEEQVRGIGDQVGTITQLFAGDRSRGDWGQISLLRIFEMGGLVEKRDYEAQFYSGEGTPDAVVKLPGDRRIVIDAKFPVARFRDALVVEDPEERIRLLKEQAKELERVGKSLIDKGYADLASGDYVVMYLPSQAVYEAAATASPEVIERLLSKRVVVAGPATLFPMLLSVGTILTDFRAVQQTTEILDEVRELHRRIAKFVEHLDSVGAHLRRAVDAFNKAVGSWTGRLSPQLIRLGEFSGRGEPGGLRSVDEAVREVPAGEAPGAASDGD